MFRVKISFCRICITILLVVGLIIGFYLCIKISSVRESIENEEVISFYNEAILVFLIFIKNYIKLFVEVL